MGENGLRTWNELHGISCIELKQVQAYKQSITISRSFEKELYDIKSLEEAITPFSAMATEKLRKQNSVASQLYVYILTYRHREDKPHSYEIRNIYFPTPTNSSIDVIKCALEALKNIFKQGFGNKKAGVTLSGIAPNNYIQTSMFDNVDRKKHNSLMKTIDNLNQNLGRTTVMLGRQSLYGIQTNREHLSPCYTTDWNDIIEVKI